MKTYFVTGGAGFIGSNFILYMLEKYDDIKIINFDKLTYAGNLENLKSVQDDARHIFIQGDICDKEAVEKIFSEHEVDYVVNFAAETHVDRSVTDPEIFARTNVLGTLNLLNCAKFAWQEGEGFREGVRYLQVSTDEVYGSLGETGYFTENTPLDAHSPYSASKAGADMLVKAYHDTYAFPVLITRCSNNYGPFQFPEKLIPLMINNALAKKPLPIYGTGMNVRDWLYVEDHCKAIDVVLERGTIGEVYNVGGHNERPNVTIVKTIVDYLHKHVDKDIDETLITYVADRKGHDLRYGIDPRKITNALGWTPETPFDEGIVKTIQWYIDNKDWLDSTTSGEYQNYYSKMYGDK